MFSQTLHYLARNRKEEPALIPRNEVESALARLCAPPPSTKRNADSRPTIANDQYQDISRLLKELEAHLHQSGWSSRPRTYVVLRNIGHVELMPQIVALKYTDYSFPYTFEKVPEFLHDGIIIDKFMQAQKAVLTDATRLEDGAEGVYAHPKNGDDLYHVVKHLGSGGFG